LQGTCIHEIAFEMNNSVILRYARCHANIGPQARRAVVVQHVAGLMGVKVPAGRAAGYKLLARWVEQIRIDKRNGKVPPTPRKAKKKRFYEPEGDPFLSSYEWRKLRMVVIKKRGARCECCGASPQDGKTQINVDHIKPRKTHPELALTDSNLQVLCGVCNHGKGNWDDTDWRSDSATVQ
jgi:5-methylcytosine-specific restriction endonuclease McrA